MSGRLEAPARAPRAEAGYPSVVPFRDAQTYTSAPLARGALLRRYPLHEGPAGPFAPGGDKVIAAPTAHGFELRVTRSGMRSWRLYDLPLPDVAVVLTARGTGSTLRLGVCARRFSVGSVDLGYCGSFRPGLGLARIEAFAGTHLAPVTQWRPSTQAQAAGEWNEIELRASGDVLVMLINGVVEHIARDASFGRGVPAVEIQGDSGDAAVLAEVAVYDVD